MKISCFIFGEQALAIQCGDLLLNANHEVRGIVAENPDIGTWAQTRGVRLVDPASDVGAVLKERPFDYLFSIANMKLLPKEIVALPRRGTINFHDGPLPRYSGVHATSWAILNGEARHGITWHFIGDRVDGGSILKQCEIEIAPDETAFSLNAKCFEAGIESFAELMNVLRSGTVRACEQDLSQRTYFGMFRRPPAACVVSWQKNAAEISALVRATEFGPYKRDGARKDSDRRGILSLSESGSAQRPRACATWIDHGAGGGPNYCVYAGSAGGHQSVPDSGRPARATG